MTFSTKQLNEEGLTKDFLKCVNLSSIYSPVQLRPKEEPVKLVRNTKGYWVILPDGTYLKDEKNKLFVIAEKEAKIGRARYLLNFKEEITQHKIDLLVSSTKQSLDDEAKRTIQQMREILIYAGYLEPKDIEWVRYILEEANAKESFRGEQGELNRYQQKQKEAKELATDKFIKTHEWLIEAHENKDYDRLFIMLRQEGIPTILTIKKENIDLVAQYFEAPNILDTIDELKEKGHLYCFCKFYILSQLEKNDN